MNTDAARTRAEAHVRTTTLPKPTIAELEAILAQGEHVELMPDGSARVGKWDQRIDDHVAGATAQLAADIALVEALKEKAARKGGDLYAIQPLMQVLAALRRPQNG